MSNFKDSIFRAYDIRGIVGEDFDESFAYSLGRAFAQVLREQSQTSALKRSVALGRDCRLTSEGLLKNFSAGLSAEGLLGVDYGIQPSPQLYYTVISNNLCGGVQVTGSHNPSNYNGFKLLVGNDALSGTELLSLRDRVLNLAGKEPRNSPEQRPLDGALSARESYVRMLTSCSMGQMGERRLKVVVDSGNGVGGLVAPQVYRNLGCDVLELFSEPDGNFPNHHPDPSIPANVAKLKQTVLETGAHLGLAFDGDADRVCAVDNLGELLFGDSILLLLAADLIETIPGLLVLADVKCSDLVFRELPKLGARVEMVPTGHSLIKKRMRETGAQIAGEMSGHLFFSHRYYGFDDAIHGGARLLEIVSRTSLSLHELMSRFPKRISTPEIHLHCADQHKFFVVEKVKNHFSQMKPAEIDGVRLSFPHGFALVRASNTQPLLVVRFEALSTELIEEYRAQVLPVVKRYVKEFS